VREGFDEARIIYAEELRRTIGRKSHLLITLSVPALLLVLLVAVPAVRAMVVDRDREEPKPTGIVNLSQGLSIDAPPGYLMFDSRQDGIDAISQETVRDFFLIPADYMTSGRMEWLHSEGGVFSGIDPGPGRERMAKMRALLRLALAEDRLDPDALKRAIAPAGFTKVRIGKDGLPVTEDAAAAVVRLLTSFVSALLLLVAVLLGASTLLQAVAEDKENRMIEIVLTSARPMAIMTGKVLGVGTAGLMLLAVWTGSFILIVPRIVDVFPDAPALKLDVPNLAWMLGFFLAGYFLSSVILAAVGAAASSVREATQISVAVAMPMMTPIFILEPFLGNPDGGIARTLSFIPLTAPLSMMMRLGTGEPPVVEIAASLAVTLVGGVLMLWVAARIFRAGLLMYGQRMSLRGAFNALRQAG